MATYRMEPESENPFNYTLTAFSRVWNIFPVFSPVWDPTGRLYAVEMLSRIQDCNSKVYCNPHHFFNALSAELLIGIFNWQVRIARSLSHWCISQRVSISVNVTRPMGLRIISDSVTSDLIQSCHHGLMILELSEYFLQPERIPSGDPLIQELKCLAPLWLDDFGRGTSSFSIFEGNVFDAVKLDRTVLDMSSRLVSGREFIRSLAGMAKEVNAEIIAEGIADRHHEIYALSCGIDGCQGWLWPEVPIDLLTSVPEFLPRS